MRMVTWVITPSVPQEPMNSPDRSGPLAPRSMGSGASVLAAEAVRTTVPSGSTTSNDTTCPPVTPYSVMPWG